MLPSSNEFNPNCRSTTPLISRSERAECVEPPGQQLSCGRGRAAADGQDRCLKSAAEQAGRSLMNDSYSPPPLLYITWALPPTQHSAAQYHIVSSDTVGPGGEGGGDNLRCVTLRTEKGSTGDTEFVSATVTWPDTGAENPATSVSDLRENIVLCHAAAAAASRAAPATGKRQTPHSLFL